ncbi:alkaline phosphatase [Polymorphobacter sp.]|uniref:alkaline phosphatase n=1 Tax=Polymorphobacter sp. TaxID=1909290 RepID=UPI003F711FE6
MSRALIAAILLATTLPAAAQQLQTPVKNDDYWQMGRAVIAQRLKVVHRPKRAKNIVLMIGDGMGVATVTAARIFAAQYPDDGSPRRSGEENVLSFETMPYTALIKTYNTDAQVSDSAGTASAINTGVKTRIGYINFAANQTAEDCRNPTAWPRTIAELAKAQGMAVGIVSTARITHATPAAVFAHVPNRNWEGADKAFPADARATGCKDIATQLVEFAPNNSQTGIDLVLGGGTNQFLPVAAGGKRDDGKNLVDAWKQRHPGGTYVSNASSFRALDTRSTAPVLGLFTPDHMSFEVDRDKSKEPSLAEMTGFALKRLQATAPKGYYLMIEAGRIDHAHHASNPYRALSETQQLHRAVETVLKTVNLDDTLVLVTADHSHTLSIAGYSERGNDILGFIKNARGGEGSSPTNPEGFALDDRGQPMTTLSYANGPFVSPPLSRLLPPNDPNYLAAKTYGTPSESHAGDDVPLYATGARAHLVGGVLEQNVIFHIIAEALGWR